MRTLTVKSLITVALLVAFFTVRADYSKKIHKAWGISKVKALSIDNKFGNINFVDNRDDSVTIDIFIEIKDVPENKAESIANQIDFLFSLNDGILNAKTEFSDRFKSNSDFNIIYTINIPIDRDLTVENKFGNVTLGDLKANGMFDIKYGNIYGQNLQAPGGSKIKLELRYGNGTFESVNQLYANLGYSKLNTGDMESAEFETQYSIVQSGNVGTMIAESKYDNYTLESTKELTVESKFTNWKVDLLKSKFAIETQYGDVDVNEVSKSFESIKVDNGYGNIKIGISPEASYQLQSESYYCNVSFPNANIIKQIEDNNHKTIKATIGKTNPSAMVSIESRYGKVKLMK